MNVDTQWVRDNAGIGEALREVNLLDSEQDCAFMLGAQWHAAGMAVCEFLADLARIYAQCPRCSGFGEYNVARGYRDPARYVRCYFCRGSGKRVTP